MGCKNIVLLCHSFCCILRTCLGCIVRLVHAYYICTYTGSRKLSLLQQLSLQHVMVSELCTDFTATLHLQPGLYSSYTRLSSFMSILYVICTSSEFFTSCTTSLHFTLICHFPLHTSLVTDHSLYVQRGISLLILFFSFHLALLSICISGPFCALGSSSIYASVDAVLFIFWFGVSSS